MRNKKSAAEFGDGIPINQLAQDPRGAPVRASPPIGPVGSEVDVFTIISKQAGQDEYESGWCILDAGLLKAAGFADVDAVVFLEELCARFGRELVYVEKAERLTLDCDGFARKGGW